MEMPNKIMLTEVDCSTNGCTTSHKCPKMIRLTILPHVNTTEREKLLIGKTSKPMTLQGSQITSHPIS